MISSLLYEVTQLRFLTLSPLTAIFLILSILYVVITRSMYNQFSIILFLIPDLALKLSSKLIQAKIAVGNKKLMSYSLN